MTEPIGPRLVRDFERASSHPADLPPPTREPWGLKTCRGADTVFEGYLCNEPAVVSDACRKPKNRFDAYVCDEPRMKRLQDGIVRETMQLLKSIVLALLTRRPDR
jgi:hypothetical protein